MPAAQHPQWSTRLGKSALGWNDNGRFFTHSVESGSRVEGVYPQDQLTHPPSLPLPQYKRVSHILRRSKERCHAGTPQNEGASHTHKRPAYLASYTLMPRSCPHGA